MAVAGFCLALAAERGYVLSGRVRPAGASAITVFGATSPFHASSLSGEDGRFTFKNLVAGTYTISVFNPEYGEVRRTIEVGPGTARKQRVSIELEFTPADFDRAAAMQREKISVRELSIPDKARERYEDALKALTHRDADTAVEKLEQAVKIAPQFSAAWNQLGTISYQGQKYQRAEECFRKALAADPQSYPPLVNLAGVLVTLGRTKEALDYNRYAVLARPNDALANSQLGQAYFQAGDEGKALQYLEAARRIDPAHFSHPQLVMAEIHARRGDRKAAAADLADFLKYHPDWPEAAKLREKIEEWK